MKGGEGQLNKSELKKLLYKPREQARAEEKALVTKGRLGRMEERRGGKLRNGSTRYRKRGPSPWGGMLGLGGERTTESTEC